MVQVVVFSDYHTGINCCAPLLTKPSLLAMSSIPSAHDKSALSSEEDEGEQALILFDSARMERMQTTQRLPGTYIGVRRIRPSSRQVQRAHVAKKQGFYVPPPPLLAFKVVDPKTGQERRMTAAEKKAAKQERMRMRQLQIQQAKAEKKQNAGAKERVNSDDEDGDEEKIESSLEIRVAHAPNAPSKVEEGKYYYFKTNEANLEQELADLRGDRCGVPPILLSPGQAHVAKSHNLVPLVNNTSRMTVAFDDTFAEEWAAVLRASMMPAIQTRRSEDMRDMVYDIVPQVWNRLRPNFDRNQPVEEDLVPTEAGSHLTLPCTIRPPSSTDKEWNILVEALYQGRDIHIGCGTKFGCDILLYDGPRSQRHSFAGLRLVRPMEGTRFPLPRAYDLAGYVRCLNTAGKLALLATVIHNDEKGHSVSIIDLALEKIDLVRKPKPSKSLDERVQTLAKT